MSLDSQVISTIHANTSQLSTFTAAYVYDLMSLLAGIDVDLPVGGNIDMTPIMMGNIGTFELDGNFTWRENMTVALEELAQNATLSLLSGQIFSPDPKDPELLKTRRIPARTRSLHTSIRLIGFSWHMG